MKILRKIFVIVLVLGILRIQEVDADVFELSSGDSVVGDSLGSSVSISGNYAIAGSPQDSGQIGTESGSAQIFSLSPTGWIQQMRLTARDTEPGDRFGQTVSMSGDYAIVGAPGKAGSTGAAYIFIRSNAGWLEQAKLIPPDGEAADFFGFSLAMDGDTVIIGAYRHNMPKADSGAAYIFVRRGTAWIQQAKLTPNDVKLFDWFGYSVGISGDTAIVGALRNDAKGEDSGAAYVFVRSGSDWSEQAKIVGDSTTLKSDFGFSVAVSGNTAVVGSPRHGDTGSAYIFVREGTTWVQKRNRVRTSMFPQDKNGNGFGYAVAISGDTVIIGANNTRFGDDVLGAAYLFVPDGPFWGQRGRLVASNGRSGDNFGGAVGIQGDSLIVGASGHNAGGSGSGAAYVFSRDKDGWTQRGILFDSDTAIEDQFGGAVSISGSTAIVGAQQDDDAGSNAGAAYVFVRQGRVWTLEAKLIADDAKAGDLFGFSVAISGDIAAIGAYGNDAAGPDSGAVYIFARSGVDWRQQAKFTASDTKMFDHFGASLAIDGNTLIVGAHGADDAGSDSGAAYVFVGDGARWTQQAKLTANDAVTGDLFGFSVSIVKDTAVVGAHQNDAAGTDSGAAYVFMRTGALWTQQVKLSAKDAGIGDMFGYAVSMSDDYLLVGAPRDDNLGIDAGAAYIFVRSGTRWIEQAKLVAHDAEAGDEFGASVALSGDRAIVGAWKDDHPLQDDRDDPAEQVDKGSAYSFLRSGFSWGQKMRMSASIARFDRFGVSVAISGNYAIAGADGIDKVGSDSGAAYIFDAVSLGFLSGDVFLPVEPSSLKPTLLGQMKQTALRQNYPNPFNPETWIPYQLSTAAHVVVKVYDIRGQLVRTLSPGFKPAGLYLTQSRAVFWDGRDTRGELVSSGIYIYEMEAGQFRATRKMVVVK